ncbi:MAG: hypothetical protein M3N19_02355 [Candidatus Eremiobacteraeota bacterium]|nr:hypothetical protein [Candidatus Eremiobacteraeota bacterium]
MAKASRRLSTGEDLFIVRIRRDTDPQTSLRGYVDEISSSQRFYFTSVSDLNAFFERHIAAPHSERKRP